MKKAFLTLAILTIILNFTLLTNNGFALCGWYRLNSGTTQGLRSVHFINNYTGWAVGWGSTVLKTTNGGMSWRTQTAYGDFQSVTFINANTGWIVGGGTQIYKTINGGNNWTASTLPYGSLQLIIQFVNDNTGYICGYNGLVLKSTNGGDTWTRKTTNTTSNLTGIDFVNAQTGWITGDYGVIKKSTDGGETWIPQVSGTNVNLGKIDFVCHNNGWISTSDGKVLRTTNGGANWISVQTPTKSWLTTVYFFNCKTGYAAGGNYDNTKCDILKTTNGGITWISQPVPTNDWLGLIFFASENVGFAVGHNGTILKTMSGGDAASLTNENFNEPQGYLLNQNFPNPFNPVTKISFNIPEAISNITLKVFDNTGREVATLLNTSLPAGFYEVNFDGSKLSSGIYFYRFDAGIYSRTMKMSLVK